MKTRGTISLVFDDGYEHILHDVVPMLDAQKIPGVFATPLEGTTLAQETGFPVASWQAWLEIKKNGHEIAAHGITHTSFPKLSSEELEKELSGPKETLQATTLVYPGGAHNETVMNRAAAHYTAARSVIRGFETIPPAKPLQLKTVNFTKKNFSVMKANAMALWAYLTDSWLIETYHIIADTTDSQYAVSPAQFEQHVRFLKRLPLAIRTIHEITTL